MSNVKKKSSQGFQEFDHRIMTYQFSFEKLVVWQKARSFVLWSYEITSTLPQEEKFGLTSQINRAAVSISANIAEGNSKNTNKEKLRYISLAYGSLMEVLNHYFILFDLKYIDEKTFSSSKELIVEIAKLLNGLRKSIEKSH